MMLIQLTFHFIVYAFWVSKYHCYHHEGIAPISSVCSIFFFLGDIEFIVTLNFWNLISNHSVFFRSTKASQFTGLSGLSLCSPSHLAWFKVEIILSTYNFFFALTISYRKFQYVLKEWYLQSAHTSHSKSGLSYCNDDEYMSACGYFWMGL